MVTLPAGSVAMAGGALALRDGALQVDGINRAAYMHCTDGSVMLVLGFAKPITKREEAAAFLPAVAGQWRGLGPGDHTWETVEGWGTDAKAQRGSRASQKRNRREDRELEEAAARDRAARGGVCMPHVLLAAAIAQSQPQQSFPAALAPRPPVRPILGHDLERLAARMSLDETIVPWAEEEEVEWEPAAGYEQSTLPSLDLLECGECDSDADVPPRHQQRSSGGNTFSLCDCAGGGGVSTRGLDQMGRPNPAPPSAHIRHLEYCGSETAAPRKLKSFVLLPGQLCAQLCAAAKSALRSMSLDALYVRKRGGNGPLLPKSETDHERPDRIHFGCCAEAEEGWEDTSPEYGTSKARLVGYSQNYCPPKHHMTRHMPPALFALVLTPRCRI